MKFKRFSMNKYQYFPFIKNECFQLNINLLIFSLWNKSLNFLFLVKKLISSKSFNSQIKIKNICIESGRANNIKKKLWLSRIQIRNLSSKRMICGLRKSSW